MISQTSFIEGIGDEVVIVTGILFLIVCMFIAWVSTHVHWENRPLTLFVFRQQQQPINQSQPGIVSEEISQEDNSQDLTTNEKTDETPETAELQHATSRSINAAENIEQDDPNSCPGSISLRLKFLDERQKVVRAQLSESILNFKRKHFQQELSNNNNVRLIYKGRELKDNRGEKLEQYGLTEESTIHCLVTRRQAGDPRLGEATPNLANNQDPHGPSLSRRSDELDISGLMFPLFGLILSLIWYFRFSYRQYFNVLSTFALIGISLLFFVAAYASYSHRSAVNHSPITPPIRIHHINVRQRSNE